MCVGYTRINSFYFHYMYMFFNMSEDYISELCRLCLYKSGQLFDIFGVNGRHGYLAAEVIQDLLQIEVTPSDGFPRCVCSECLDKLTDFKLFKDQCLENRSSFEQEFGMSLALHLQDKEDASCQQDPVCSSSIKTEVKTEVEIIEIVPADEEGERKEVRGVSPAPSELDVVTVDEEDNVLCLGSRDEVEKRQPAVSKTCREKSSAKVAAALMQRRDGKGRFLKKKKKKRAVGGLHLKLGSALEVPRALEVSADDGDGREERPSRLESGGKAGEQGGGGSKTSVDPQRKMQEKKVQAKTVKRLKVDASAWPTVAGDGGNVMVESQPNTHKDFHSMWNSASNKDAQHASQASEGLRNESGPLKFGGDPKSPEKRQERRRNASVQMYNEDTTLLSDVNKAQCFVVWSPEVAHKKKKKKRIPQGHSVGDGGGGGKVPNKVTQGPAQREQQEGNVGMATKELGVAVQGGKILQKQSYKCHVCSYTFSSRAMYNEHRKTHPRLPFPCDVCGKTFLVRQAMQRHRLLHTGLRPFACNLCHCAYTRLDHLKRHMQGHSVKEGFALDDR